MAVNLCVGCGICCDGTIFNRVQLRPGDDADALTGHGFTLAAGDDGVVSFHQTCHGFRDGCCTVYDDRPATCRAFECLLLQRVGAGEVDEADAVRVVKTTTEVRDRARAGLQQLTGDHVTQSVSRLLTTLSEQQGDDGAVPSAENARTLLDVGSLNHLIRRHFWSAEAQRSATERAERESR